MDSKPAVILLLWFAMVLCGDWTKGEASMQRKLKRQRREWVIAAPKLKENHDYTSRPFIAKIRSDLGGGGVKLFYSLSGPGATMNPLHLFVVDETTGLVRITGILDREFRDNYPLISIARFANGSMAEEILGMKFEVVDENDNSPVFDKLTRARVNESSIPGTMVTQVTATDADQPDTLHTKISYSIIRQEPPESTMLFHIDRDTGVVSVKESTIDRERQDLYILTIQGTDMAGAPDGNTATATLEIKVLDINDNIPTLDKDEYSGSIPENTAKIEVMRFQALDQDLKNTDNWLAEFDIVSGNDDLVFSIHTDPKTNEGVLTLNKPVDFEANPDIQLGLVVQNKAPPIGGGAGGDGGGDGVGGGDRSVKLRGKIYPVKFSVIDLRDGPVFKPAVKPVFVSESAGDSLLSDVITTYVALNGDTGEPAQNVQYAKSLDPDNWLSINPETAEVKLKKIPDRESPFLVNGTYYAKILCMTNDMPSRTATGTIALEVGDANDNCPKLTSTVEYLCSDTQLLNVTAEDRDAEPNGAPLRFTLLPGETTAEWGVEPRSDTSVSLRALKPLWPGQYELTLVIEDQQGLACPDPQRLQLKVCTCSKGWTCGESKASGQIPSRGEKSKSKASGQMRSRGEKSSSFGKPGIGVLILGFLVLLFVAVLLLTCSCGSGKGGFTELPFSINAHLISYHTEGQGEDREVPLIKSPVLLPQGGAVAATNKMTMMDVNKINCMSSNAAPVYNMATVPSDQVRQSAYGGLYCDFADRDFMDMNEMEQRDRTYSQVMEEHRLDYDSFALSDAFLDEYFSQKLECAAQNPPLNGTLLVYDYEGQGSPAGSLGCCSFLESHDDLQFLNDLGSKFKTLAEICSPPKPAVQDIVDSAHPNDERQGAIDRSNINVAQSSTTSNVNINQSSASNVNINQSSSSTATAGQSAPTSHVTKMVSHPAPWSPPAGQTFLLQQPMYYTTAPMMQPVHYVVEPQVHNTVLLAERQATTAAPNVQGMIVVNGPPGDVTGQPEHQHTIQRGHTGMFTVPHATLERGAERLVYVEESQAGGQRLRSSSSGQADLSRRESLVLMGGGGGGGQAILVGGVSGLSQFQSSLGTLHSPQNIMLTSGHFAFDRVSSDQAVSDQGFQIGHAEGNFCDGHFMVESPTRRAMSLHPLSPAALGRGAAPAHLVPARRTRQGSLVLVERQVNGEHLLGEGITQGNQQG